MSGRGRGRKREPPCVPLHNKHKNDLIRPPVCLFTTLEIFYICVEIGQVFFCPPDECFTSPGKHQDNVITANTDGSWKNALTSAADQQVSCTPSTDGRSCRNSNNKIIANSRSFSETRRCCRCSKNVTQHIVGKHWDQLSREND